MDSLRGLLISVTSIYFIRSYISDSKKINSIVVLTFCLFGYLLTPFIISFQILYHQTPDLIKRGDWSSRTKIEMFLKDSQEASTPQEREAAAQGFFLNTGGSLVYKDKDNQFVEYTPTEKDKEIWLKNKDEIAEEEKSSDRRIKEIYANWIRGLYYSLPLILLLAYLAQVGWNARKESKMDKSAERITNWLGSLIIIGFLLITLDRKYHFITMLPPSIIWVFNIAYHILIGFTLAYSLYLLASRKAQNKTHPVCLIAGTLLLIFLGSSVQMAVGSTTSALSQSITLVGLGPKASDYQKLFDTSNPKENRGDGSALSGLLYTFTGTKYPYKPNGQRTEFVPTEDQQLSRDEQVKTENKVKQTELLITRIAEGAFTNNLLLLIFVPITTLISLLLLTIIRAKEA